MTHQLDPEGTTVQVDGDGYFHEETSTSVPPGIIVLIIFCVIIALAIMGFMCGAIGKIICSAKEQRD